MRFSKHNRLFKAILFSFSFLFSFSSEAQVAYEFNGNDTYITPGLGVTPTSAITIEAWIKPHSFTEYAGIITKLEWTGANGEYSGYGLYVRANGHLGGFLGIDDDDEVVESNISLDTVWQHVAMTFDGTVQKLYIDGVVVDSNTVSGSITYTYSSTQNLRIGRYEDSNEDIFYDGEIEDLRIWDVGRTVNQLNDKKYEKLIGTEPGLVSYFPFDECFGDITYDLVTDESGFMFPFGLINRTTGIVPISNIYYVDIDATGIHNGGSWSTAFKDLQKALDRACPNSQIWIAEGTYYPTEAPDDTSSLPFRRAFHFDQDLEIYGGFVGWEDSLNQRFPQFNRVKLSGDLLDNDDIQESGDTLIINVNSIFDNTNHVIITDSVSSATLIDGITISGGVATLSNDSTLYSGHSFQDGDGGGMANIKSKLRLNNCIFEKNISNRGGAIYNDLSPIELTNCTFRLNASGSGAAMYNIDLSDVELNDCLFLDNWATFQGGAITDLINYPEYYNCSFTSNFCNEKGGALFSRYSYIFVDSCSFSVNKANKGGAQYAQNNTYVDLNNSMFFANDALLHGGAQFIDSSNLVMQNCQFDSDEAANYGGAQYTFGSDINVTDCTYLLCEAGYGGSQYNHTSDVIIDNCLFENSKANAEGGAQYNISSDIELNSTRFLHCEAILGGGQYNNGSNMELYACTFDSCLATFNGGGQSNLSSDLTLENSFFTSCVATNNGGGQNNAYSSIEMSNCVFAENDAGSSAGAMYNLNSAPLVANCNFVLNSANWGGALQNTFSGSAPNFINSIFWGNTADSSNNTVLNHSGGTASFSHSLLEGSGGSVAWDSSFGVDSSGNIDANPKFVDIQDIEGLDGELGTDDDGLALTPFSPAINSGTFDNVSHDYPLVYSFQGPIDIGPYEWQTPSNQPIPTEFDAYVVSPTNVVIGWDLDSTANFQQQVRYRVKGTTPWLRKKVRGFPVNSLWLKNLLTDTEYEYQYRIIYGPASAGPWSARKTFITYSTNTCSPPEGTFVRYSSSNPTRVQLICNHEPDATSGKVQVRWKPLGSSIWDYKGRNGNSMILVTSLMTDTEYEYQFRARCGTKWSGWAVVDTFRTLSNAAPRPASARSGTVLVKDNQLLIYPNPTSSSLFIQNPPLGTARLEIVDLQGKSVLALSELDTTNSIPVHMLRSGHYFIQLIDQKGRSYSAGFIKQ